MEPLPPIDASTVIWRLVATFFFVLLNGFFVAAEFSLVKVRGSRIDALAEGGSGSAGVIQAMLRRTDLYLSSCQFGITVASLILGWLAEPAIARLLVEGAGALGLEVGQVGKGPLVHGVSLGIALAIVTTLHMTLGEQAPKILAVTSPEATALRCAYPLKFFTLALAPPDLDHQPPLQPAAAAGAGSPPSSSTRDRSPPRSCGGSCWPRPTPATSPRASGGSPRTSSGSSTSRSGTSWCRGSTWCRW